ncbi:LysR family transcriptional regulator [Mesorhizobium sangaii]|uniref:DNA-binding transcriptional LysR family regulator n=1 Tax=Mesorhizobium sangaii TaxID=505389 RepID=A0A841P748_9HYPH|nr:LysR family transcriptional regulator [Mesorhizobium sangaii]MBB6409213.1 DNA-binding transcriptional LysR family regulator [Mesorhizobium sangaii]
MKWRFEDILTFINVVEAGSVTSAATRLNTSKSVVSKRISDLEAALRVELFRRSAGSVKPNELARSLYEQIVPLVQAMTEATEGVSDRTEGLTGRLRMVVPVSFGTQFLGPIIAEFASRHPDLEIAVDYEDRPVSLTQGNYDLGIRIGQLNESSLKARKLCDCARMVCCSPEYSRKFGLPKSIAELAQHTCIDYAHVRASDLWQFESEGDRGRPIPVLMRSRIVANNFEAIKDMAVAGLGLVLLPEFLAAGPLREGSLIAAMPHIAARADTISAVYPYTRHVSPKVRGFIDHLVAAFVPPLPWHPRVNDAGNPRSNRATDLTSFAA